MSFRCVAEIHSKREKSFEVKNIFLVRSLALKLSCSVEVITAIQAFPRTRFLKLLYRDELLTRKIQ